MNSKTIALIPARAGSKRFPGKNTREFNGRPLACWTLDFASKSKFFDFIYLSTDIDDIKEKASNDVRVCPRPPELANDSSTLLDVIRYTCEKEKFGNDDIVILLPITGPLRIADDVRKGIDLFHHEGGRRTVLSVNVNSYPVGMTWSIEKNKQLTPLFPQEYNTTLQKQRHRVTYQFNDLFVIDSVAGFLKTGRNLFGKEPLAVVIPPERSMPIDYEYQFVLAEVLHRIGLQDGIFTRRDQ